MQTANQSFPRQARLLSARDYSRVFDGNEKRASNRYALLLALPTTEHPSRLGLVIAKKHVRLAVDRNRIKRLAREVFRRRQHHQSYDVVLLARKGISDLSNAAVIQQLQQLWHKIDPEGQPER